jgi:hypothetical protein
LLPTFVKVADTSTTSFAPDGIPTWLNEIVPAETPAGATTSASKATKNNRMESLQEN